MELVTLEQHLRLDIPEIDVQHEELIVLVNEFHAALEHGVDKAERDDLLARLMEETRRHFEYEEMMMSRYGYSEHQQHKSEHDRLMRNLLDLVDRYRRGELMLSIAVALELKCWGTIHIEKSDVPLGVFLRDKLKGEVTAP